MRKGFPIRFIAVLVLSTALLCPFGLAQGASQTTQKSAIDFTGLPLEDLFQVEVVSASGFSQKTEQAPASVTIITSQEIQRYGYRSLIEILNSLRSFYMTYDRSYAYLGVRGFTWMGDYNTRILLLVNGHRINSVVYSSAFIDSTFPIELDLIDRVEVVRGPVSSLYGTNAFFGVINVITKSGSDLNGARVSAEKWSFDTYRGSISLGGKTAKGLDYVFSGGIHDSEGSDLYFPEFDDPDTNNGVAVKNDYERIRRFFGQIAYKGFSLQAGFVSRKKGLPTAPYGIQFNDARNFSVDSLGFLSATYDHAFSDRTSLSTSLYYDHHFYDMDYHFDRMPLVKGATPGLLSGRTLDWGDRWGVEAKVDRRLAEKHMLTVGSEFRHDFRLHQRDENQLGFMDINNSTVSGAFYIQDEFKASDKVTLNLGLRHDNYETFGGSTNPRLGFIYSPLKMTTFKLLYGHAFRAPNAYESYYDDGLTQKTNPKLGPENMRALELVFEQQLGKNVRLVASGFHDEIKDMITLEVDPGDEQFIYVNRNDVHTSGMEFEMTGKWNNGIMSRFSYSYQQTKDAETHRQLPNAPRHLIKFNFSAPLLKEKAYAGLETTCSSSRSTIGENSTGSAAITNLIFSSRKLFKGAEFTAGIYNVLDRRYRHPASIEQPESMIEQDGRSYRLRISYGFDFAKPRN